MKVQELTKLFEVQARLDEKISVNHPIEEGEDRLEKKVAALLVEIGEALNEWRGFKFWSTDKVAREKKLLEELVDCLHFILSIGLDLQLEDEIVVAPFSHENRAIEYTFIQLMQIDWIEDYETGFDLFLGFCQLMEFTPTQLYVEYFAKNEINHQRQEQGY